MIKDIMIFDKGKYICTIREDIDFSNGEMVQLLSTVINAELIERELIDILYVKDMDYGIVIPRYIADEMNGKIEKLLTRMDGADIDGDMINGEYHHLLDESRGFGKSVNEIVYEIKENERRKAIQRNI